VAKVEDFDEKPFLMNSIANDDGTVQKLVLCKSLRTLDFCRTIPPVRGKRANPHGLLRSSQSGTQLGIIGANVPDDVRSTRLGIADALVDGREPCLLRRRKAG